MNRVLALIFAVALAIPTLNAADEVDVDALQNYIQALEQRLEQLEAQTGVIQERQVQIEEEAMTYLESLGALKELSDRVELSGNVDVIYSSTDDDANGDSNDVFVDQVYLGLAIDVSDNVSAYVSLQNENTAGDFNDLDTIGVYEASVTVGLSDNMSLTAGKQHFNFINDAEYGNFIADTLVRQMAECRETGLALNLSNDA
ncbi:MAG: porin, partial [Lentisphaeria bacterium]|nr:porin [Lentisphaeria bacterium]